ncbi:type IV pilus biogenesis protein PilM [Salmonella enterica]|nr:pilus assembly protein PilP [Salmonella enterica]ECS6408755.1 pilus assembly protein PilP [Salmonella enterica subsp. enterica serovar Poona]EAO0042541.1 pilus assembly protein PilP [Salmonella enterica]EAT9274806.1 pilus assembly protein PilP [Salmonella enterica]EBB5486258.1 pilus assembly protein PilP [Salmonella enterica]
MGWMIMALGMVFMLVTGHVVERQRLQTQTGVQMASARLPAQQMLGLAAAINDWCHDHPLRDGMAPLSSLALVSPPDSRIHHRIVSDRLWVWRADTPGLVSSLRMLSDGSALVGSVSRGRLVWLSGTDTGLALPPGVKDGDVVYLN